MTKNLIFIVITLGLVASIIFLDVPIVQGVLNMRKEITVKQEELVKKEAFIKTIEKLIDKYKNSEESLKKLDDILPGDSDVPNLIVQIEAIAKESGMSVGGVNIAVSNQEGASKAETVRSGGSAGQEKVVVDYQVVTINLKMSGNYATLKAFLRAVEENMRLIDIESIAFSTKSREIIGSTFEFDMVLSTYYYIN
jgi:Tfp pilus assembly protein PilO